MTIFQIFTLAVGLLFAVWLIDRLFFRPGRRRRARAKWEEKERIRNAEWAEKERKQRYERDLSEFHCAASELRKLPGAFAFASQCLASADKNFRERAFSPFWNDIGSAAQQIAFYQVCVDQLALKHGRIDRSDPANFHLHESITRTSISFPSYRVRIPAPDHWEGKTLATLLANSNVYHISELPDPTPILTEMHRLIRAGQTDFQFATIYEQIKTQSVLQEGFPSMKSSIKSLKDAVESSGTKIVNSISKLEQTTKEQIGYLRGDLAAHNAQITRQLSSISSSVFRLRW